MLLAHTDTIDKIEMWEWDDGDCVVVLDIREAVAELTVVNEIANTTDGLAELVLGNLALH